MPLGIRRAIWVKMNINRKWKQLIIKALQRISLFHNFEWMNRYEKSIQKLQHYFVGK